MDEQVAKIIESLQNENEAAITLQVNKEGKILIDYKIPEGSGVNADDLAFMAANMIIAAKKIVGNIRYDISEQGNVNMETFDNVMKKYLQETPEEPQDPLSR